jgi:2-polyprenyl-6-methoxyphenol hydroxylase-like FAD-dependent oxidoreductase
VIGADGLHSNVRRLAFADGELPKYLGYYTAAFTVPDYAHREKDVYIGYSSPGRQVARYSLRDGRSTFFFMFARDTPLDLPHGDRDAQRMVLAEQFAGAGWECDEILHAMHRADDLYFDAVAQVRIPTWSHGRVALVGDAAYCPSLLAGEGTGLAMAGAYVLASALHSDAPDYASAFQVYERTLRPLIDRKQRAAERLARWFAPRTRFGIWIRNALTSSMRLPFIGSRMAKATLGESVQLPD